MTPTDLLNIAQIIFADIILSGDNALVIGMAGAMLVDGAPQVMRLAGFSRAKP